MNKTIIVALALAAIIMGAGAVFLYYAAPFVLMGWDIESRRRADVFDRARMEAIVIEVRAFQLKPGATGEYRLDDLKNPKSLRAVKPGEVFDYRGAGNVWVRLTPVGELQVTIQTLDLGHAGQYGYAYSEKRLTPPAPGSGWGNLDVPGHLTFATSNDQVDAKWWRVCYNLD